MICYSDAVPWRLRESQRYSLGNYDRQQTMNCHFRQTPNSNIVETPVVFQSAEDPFNGGPTIKDSLPFCRFFVYPLLVMFGCSDDRLCSPLPPNCSPQPVVALPSITYDITRMELI